MWVVGKTSGQVKRKMKVLVDMVRLPNTQHTVLGSVESRPDQSTAVDGSQWRPREEAAGVEYKTNRISMQRGEGRRVTGYTVSIGEGENGNGEQGDDRWKY
jgi:hypothetical protein